MLNSAILEVIVGLIFVYSLLSILVTQINTIITSVLNTRAKHLKTGIHELLGDPVVLAKFLSHPLIQLISVPIIPDAAMNAQEAQAVSAQKPSNVSNIPSDIFSRVLTDIVSLNPLDEIYGPLTTAVESLLTGAEKAQIHELIRRLQSSGYGLNDLQAAINNLTDPAHRQTLIDTLTQVNNMRQQFDANASAAQFHGLLQGIAQIQNPALQSAMDTLLRPVHSIEDAEKKLQEWFDSHMDRYSDLYRRNIQYLSLAIGLGLAVLLNVDSFQLARSLWDDPSLRGAVSAAAQGALQSGTIQNQIAQAQDAASQASAQAAAQAQSAQSTDQSGTASGAESTPEANPPAAAAETNQALLDAINATVQSASTVSATNLPIGWKFEAVPNGCPQTDQAPDPCSDARNIWNLGPANNPGWLGLIVSKLIGWALTVIAISQGAPFWFDLLNRLARGN